MSGVIVGVDESAHSQPALRWAAAYGERRQLAVTALMAWDFVCQHHLEPHAPFDPLYNEETATRVLEQQVARTLGGRHRVTCRVAEQRPPAALLDASKDCELLVLGARGMGGFQDLLLGSVSQSVLHKATCPVAVVRDDLDRGARPIVVGVNGSANSIRALRWAVDYAFEQRVELHAVYVWEWPFSAAGLYGVVPDRAKLEHDAERFLRREIAAMEIGEGGPLIEPKVVEGRPSAGLLDVSTSASMLVVGARGHGAIASALLGSVSDQVTHHATCPVIVVP
jgi:nucleotide-binding universal stress UspA family protein